MKTRVAVVGAGAFGRNHVRILQDLPQAELAAIVDLHAPRARALAEEFGVPVAVSSLDDLPDGIQAAIVATPTVTHETIAEQLLGSGVDVLIEKPIADSAEGGKRLANLAREKNRILQVGHLERFNPAVEALAAAVTVPLFFEIHRLSVFTPRSLDVDVVLDLMIHDLDIVLSLTGEWPQEIRAAGISVLSPKVDIANVRLAFPSGCVANLTASRVSTEQVRKLRLFQPKEYLAVYYKRQDLARVKVPELPTGQAAPAASSAPFIGFEQVPVVKGEPLELELLAFLNAVQTGSIPKVDGFAATNALRLAELILVTIKEHAQLVNETIRRQIHS